MSQVKVRPSTEIPWGNVPLGPRPGAEPTAADQKVAAQRPNMTDPKWVLKICIPAAIVAATVVTIFYLIKPSWLLVDPNDKDGKVKVGYLVLIGLIAFVVAVAGAYALFTYT